MKCRLCDGPTKKFLDLGVQPPANRLLSEEDRRHSEERFPLGLEYCPACQFVQTTHIVPPVKLYSDYPYATGASAETRSHFWDLALEVTQSLRMPEGSFVVDVGSNDGTLLKAFRDRGMRVLGVEPAGNLARIAEAAGVPTYVGFFDQEFALKTSAKIGRADVITACNVFTHVPDIRLFMDNVDTLLNTHGTLVLEFYYLWDIVKNRAFDQCYHEHLSYFSLASLTRFLWNMGFSIWHVDHVPVQGGSLRVYISRKGVRPEVTGSGFPREPTGEQFTRELSDFATHVHGAKTALMDFVRSIRERDEVLAGYGASAKASTLVNYIGATAEDIRYVVDDNAMKQGRYIPGTRPAIPIFPSSELKADPAKYVLLFSWNLADELVARIRSLGVRSYCYVPVPRLKKVG